MDYTVCLLFNKDLTQVLLQEKAVTMYAGRFNGVGGKFEIDEKPDECALREIEEETGVTAVSKLTHVVTISLGHDCTNNSDTVCNLYFFAGIVEADAVKLNWSPREPLKWFSVPEILAAPVTNETLAGEGDLQYALHLSYKTLKAKVGVDAFVDTFTADT